MATPEHLVPKGTLHQEDVVVETQCEHIQASPCEHITVSKWHRVPGGLAFLGQSPTRLLCISKARMDRNANSWEW